MGFGEWDTIRPEQRMIEVHADNASAETDCVVLQNDACALARWIDVLEARIVDWEQSSLLRVLERQIAKVESFEKLWQIETHLMESGWRFWEDERWRGSSETSGYITSVWISQFEPRGQELQFASHEEAVKAASKMNNGEAGE